MKKLTLLMTLICSLSVLKSQVNIQNGLVAYYPFNGNSNDESGNAIQGSVYGATLTIDRFGNSNSAYKFNGINNYIEIRNNLLNFLNNPHNAFTINVWIRITTNHRDMYTTPWDCQKAYGTGMELRTYENGVIFFIEGPTYHKTGTGSSVNFENWAMITITSKNDTIRFYNDGTYVFNQDISSFVFNNPLDRLYIGKNYQGNFYWGDIDDIRIYNRALNEQEVRSLFYEKTDSTLNPIILNGSDINICNGNAITLRANKDSTYTYQWLRNNQLILGASSDTCVISEEGYYRVVETNSKKNTKVSTATRISNLSVKANDITITCGAKPSLSIITNYTNPSDLTYLWSPKEDLDANDIAHPVVNTNVSKTYKVTVTTPSGCVATDSLTITVQPLVAFANDVTVACGEDAQLYVTTNFAETNLLTYNWFPSENLNDPYIFNPIAYSPRSSTYNVEINTTNGCSVRKSIHVNTYLNNIPPSICMISVDDLDKNVVTWKNDQISGVDSFYIYRESLSQTDQFDLIGKVSSSQPGVFIDSTSNARVQSNTYKISIKNICGNETGKSSEHKSIHLSVNKGNGNDWNLIWEQYEGVPVQSYKIYRGTSKSDLSIIGSTSGSGSSYTDITAPSGIIYYQIEAILTQSCSNLKSSSYSSSRSNIVNNLPSTNIQTELTKEINYIYPNPAHDKITIIKKHPFNSLLLIYDLNGKILLEKQIIGDKYSMNISNFKRGIYMVKLVETDNVSVLRFVKE